MGGDGSASNLFAEFDEEAGGEGAGKDDRAGESGTGGGFGGAVVGITVKKEDGGVGGVGGLCGGFDGGEAVGGIGADGEESDVLDADLLPLFEGLSLLGGERHDA